MSKILLVEDDAALTAGLCYSIEKDGHTVCGAGGVAQALRLFAGGGFDLVILDVGLPDGSGFDVCGAIRKTSSVPVLFLTACDEETSVVMGLDMGGDDYIAKPFRLRELLSRIHALLRRTAPQERAVLCSGAFRLSTGECRLYRDGTEISLTPAEYRLLHCLLSNPRRTVPRASLLDRLWDTGGDFVDANTLTVYVRRLREKLEEDASCPRLIVTVRGVGYRWDEAVMTAGALPREGEKGDESV